MDYKLAAEWYGKAAEQGNVSAMHNLGCCYFAGEGVKADITKAVALWRAAAEEGFDRSQYELGICYCLGEGVQQDYAEGLKWLRMAARQGHAMAQSALTSLGEKW